MSAFKDGLMEGKRVFVAGGTSGINLGIARRFAELGAKVAVLGRNPDKANAAAGSIGGGAIALTVDVRDYSAIRAALEEAHGRMSYFDVVVSGAAGNFLASVRDMSANAFRTMVDIDLNGTFKLFRACHDLLRRLGASLIAITVGQATSPRQLQAYACAAKAGINQLVRVPAIKWGPEVRVNGISPGPIAATEGMDHLVPDAAGREAHYARISLRRWGEIEEVAEGAIFLSSPSAAYVTGTILDGDGGTPLGDASTARRQV